MTEDQKKNLIGKLNTLKTSPIFNFSLSSKELFHSNFLYWLATAYPVEFGKLFLSLLHIDKNNSCINNVKREKGNIDLSFSYKDGETVFIENKVKSIPSKKQLEEYTEKFKNNSNTKFVLLSLSTPEFIQENENKLGVLYEWVLITYKDLMLGLEGLILNNKYHQSLLKDYLLLLDSLIQINDLSFFNDDDLFDFHDNNTELVTKLKELRIHDFYFKKMYEVFAFRIYEKLISKLPKSQIFFDKKHAKDQLTKSIYIHHGMTRATGLVDIKYFITNEIALGIQIQGESYKMLVECDQKYIQSDLDKLNKLSKSLNSNKLWFDFCPNFGSGSGSDIYPKGNKEFNQYGSVFKYKSVKLGTKRTVKEICDFIYADIIQIENNYSSIKSLIS